MKFCDLLNQQLPNPKAFLEATDLIDPLPSTITSVFRRKAEWNR